MTYKKLSEQIQALSNPQRSDTFVKLFRDAVRRGEFDAISLPERFTLPKQFTPRTSEGASKRDAKEMLFEVTPAFEAWFTQTNQDLASARKDSRLKPSVEAIESGLLDFKRMAEETRQKMQASFEKGQALGNSRAKASRGRPGTKRKK